MQIYRHLAHVPPVCRGAVLAIGNFDGVHNGHATLIRRAAELASRRKAPLAVMVFEPTPQEYFRPDGEPFRLTPFHAKARQMEALGVDILYAPPFNDTLARQSAEAFVRDTLTDRLGVRAVVVGRDFRFGAGRAGNADLIAGMAETCGFRAEIVAPVLANDGDHAGEKISSTLIRLALKAGRIEDATRWLGRPYSIDGRIEHGDARGRTLGFPTANLSLDGYLRPAYGVYAVQIRLYEGNRVLIRRGGVANFGIRPMYRSEKPLLEAFLFDFSADIYGRRMAVDFVTYLRAEAKFASVEALIAQMNKDKLRARAALAGDGNAGAKLERVATD